MRQVGFVDGTFTCLIVGPSEPPPDSHRSIIGWLLLIASLPEGINEEGFFFSLSSKLLTQQGLQSLRPPPTRIMFPCQRNDETRRWNLPSVESVAENVCVMNHENPVPPGPHLDGVKHTPENKEGQSIKLTFLH